MFCSTSRGFTSISPFHDDPHGNEAYPDHQSGRLPRKLKGDSGEGDARPSRQGVAPGLAKTVSENLRENEAQAEEGTTEDKHPGEI